MGQRRMLIAGNWKMHTTLGEARALAAALREEAGGLSAELLVCPPSCWLSAVAESLGAGVALGAQDCHMQASGAHTGDVAAAMLAELGCRYVIVGHSERRSDHGEDDAMVRAKARAARAAGLVPILCVGERLEDRDAGRAEAVVAAQLRGSVPEGAGGANLVVAYEPVWAIGTGRTAAPDDIQAMHGHVRRVLGEIAEAASIRLLYGGSVKPGNAAEILGCPDVDGALVGGASLRAADFLAIARAAPAVD